MKIPSRRNDILFPFVVLALCLLAYGLLAPWLGFYFDDWPVIATLHLREIGTFWDFYQGERPFSAWTYMLTGPLLGTRPLVWQFYSIFVRWLTVLGMYWTLRELWPQRKREVSWIALLFAVYPAFDQQAISVAYSQHWMIYALFFASMGAMLRSVRAPRRFWLWTGLGLATCAVHLMSMEYFAGLELLRPLMLGMVAAEFSPDFASQVRFSLKRWLPYLLVMISFLLWRLLVLPKGGGDPNEPSLLYGLFTRPLATLVNLGQYSLQDFLNIVFGSWYKTLDPKVYVLTDRTVLFSLAAAMAGALLTIFYLYRSYGGADEATRPPSSLAASVERSRSTWLGQAILLGVLGILLGTLPVWLTDRQTTLGLYGSRFTLAAMFGASILTVAALEWLTVRRLARVVLLGVLVGLAIGFHNRRANEFRWSWIKQTRFYWQLHWRAPDLKPGALIASDGELFLYVGRYSTSLALNILYPEDLPYPQVGHWFYELYPEFIRHPETMLQGRSMDISFRNFRYSGSSLDSLMLYYVPESGKCLWVLTPQDQDNIELPELLIGGVPLSNPGLIEPGPGLAGSPPKGIFGAEPEHTWCYYFEKADLARQAGDWQQVAELGDQAIKSGFSPNNPQEWIPFIEGYAQVGRWEEAIEKTLHVNRVNFRFGPRLCRVWEGLLSNSTPPGDLLDEIQAMRKRLECNLAP